MTRRRRRTTTTKTKTITNNNNNNKVSLFRPGQAVWYHSCRWSRRWQRLQVHLHYVPRPCVSSYTTAALCHLCLCEFVQYSCMMSLVWVRKLQLYNIYCPLVSSYNTVCIMSLVLVWVRTIQSRYVRCPCVGPYNTVCMMSLVLVWVRTIQSRYVRCPCVGP